MKQFLLFILIAAFPLLVHAQNSSPVFALTEYGVRVEPDKRLIIVLASLEAAGVKTPLTDKGAAFRQKLQTDLKDLDPKLRESMTVFVEQYKRKRPNISDTDLIAPFVSMAYALSPAPELTEPRRTTDLPGELLDVLDFAPLVREFYRRSALSSKLDEYVKDYQTAGDAMRRSTEQMVRQVLDYLHTKPQLTYVETIRIESKNDKNKNLQKKESRVFERRFFIVPELLAAKGTINFVNAGDDYYAIVPPDTDLTDSEVRRAYLQFVIDPLVSANAKDISTFRDSIKALLDERRKTTVNISPDIFLAVSRSLVAAIDANQIEYEKTRLATQQARQKIDLMKNETDKLKVSDELKMLKKSFADETALQLSEAYERGAVLSFYFSNQLKGLEESGFDVASSLRDIILSLDATKELNRLTENAEAKNRAIKLRAERKNNAANQTPLIENPVTVKLLAIDKQINGKNYATAETELKRLLEEYPTEAARIYYSIGRVSSLSAEGLAKEDAETRKQRLLAAKVAYENVIRSAASGTDPALVSLSYVALGRIYEFYGESEYAVKIYEAAMKIGDVEGGAYQEALKSRERLIKEQ